MDDIFEIIIYIVILVIGGIASAARNKNKRKSVLIPPSAPQSIPDFEETQEKEYNPLEDFLKKFEETQTPQYEPETEDDKPEAVEAEPEYVFQTEAASLEETVLNPEDEGISSLLNRDDLPGSVYYMRDDMISSGEISDAIADEDVVHENVYNIGDNIKLGIIYSEILKRKQF